MALYGLTCTREQGVLWQRDMRYPQLSPVSATILNTACVLLRRGGWSHKVQREELGGPGCEPD